VFKGLRVLAVIPARGGSKGIPKKNIAPVAGKPLISYTTELTQTVAWIDSTVVSTDSEEIAEVASQTPGVEIIWRPEELSGDRIGDHPVLRHALLAREEETGEHYDIVLMLQPTSPLRTAEDIEGCITQLREGDWDAVWSVSETELTYHPRKQLALSPEGKLDFVIPGGHAIVARQELEPVFHRNGVCYAFARDFLVGSESTYSEAKTSAVVTPGAHISIDTPEDLAAVEKIILAGRR
jgi:CMP-N,N'-diacetyllegionaminic acid synthase